MNNIFTIGEIGINHNGDLDIAKKLIDLSSEVGLDALSFKKGLSIWYIQRNA